MSNHIGTLSNVSKNFYLTLLITKNDNKKRAISCSFINLVLFLLLHNP
ncbi:hypothetical protein LEQ41_04035 [Streptococcus agalactiae]|nr:hypothetical protein [Streptococcus agalactiae]